MAHYKKDSSQTVALIYAGGSGTRLWPLSTEENPKQINSDISKVTLVKLAYKRVRKLFPKDKIILVVTRPLYTKISKLIDIPLNNFLIEPEKADTAATTMLTAMYIETYFPNAVAVIFYADQLIETSPLFLNTVKHAVRIAHKHNLFLVIGTKPTSANTEFGYIKLGKSTVFDKNLYLSASFIEKPSVQNARKLINTGRVLWNTGIYVWYVPKLLSLTKKLAPDIYEDLLQLKIHIGDRGFPFKLRQWYRHVKRLSFEKLISEKTEDLYVLVSTFEWKDVGDWASLYNLKKKDKNGNIFMPSDNSNLVALHVEKCLVHPFKKETILIGLENLVIVETEDKLLICHRDYAPQVKNAVQLLKAKIK